MKNFLENTWVKRIPLLAAIVIGIVSLGTCFSIANDYHAKQGGNSVGPAIAFAACVYALVQIRKNRWW